MPEYSKTVFIIPAAGQSTSTEVYQEIGKRFEMLRVKPVFIDINWRMRLSIEDCAEEAEKKMRPEVEANPNNEIYSFGFSLGAMVAHILSGHYEAKAEVLASMPPYFREDIVNLKAWKRLTANFFVYPGADKPKYPKKDLYQKMKTIMLFGEKELSGISKGVSAFREKQYPNSELIKVKDVGHGLKHLNYFSEVENVINNLIKTS